ncbi:MAG: HAMP domain-containing histidine kinase [Ignavibacteriales bacterium]|nr:HAMP domain-containing histidine kinase [Ignavibacteriales bacterium]
MGLSLVYEFVHKLGGDIAISSSEGKGTKFSIIFPKIA